MPAQVPHFRSVTPRQPLHAQRPETGGMVVMHPALTLRLGHKFARRGTDKAAKIARQVCLVEVTMPGRQRRETNPGPPTPRAREGHLDVRQDTLHPEDSLQCLRTDSDVDIEQAPQATVGNSCIRRDLADTPHTARKQAPDASLNDRIRCHTIRRLYSQLVQKDANRFLRRRRSREPAAEHLPAPREVLDGHMHVPQVTAGDPQEPRRRARPQAYTDDRDARFEDLDRWTRPRAPDTDSTAEPVHKMNPAIRRRAMAIPIALSANVLYPHAPHEPTEPCR
jgi:hypothetical protein